MTSHEKCQSLLSVASGSWEDSFQSTFHGFVQTHRHYYSRIFVSFFFKLKDIEGAASVGLYDMVETSPLLHNS